MATAPRMMTTRRAWLLLASTIAVQAQGLSQTYCSNQNTGADYQGVTDIYNSNGACKSQCEGRYAFAIVQWQSCWCSNYIPAQQGDTYSCSQQCPGYPSEWCGNEDEGMYGYIQLSNAPSGTMGASTNTQPSSTANSSPVEESSPPPPPSTSAPPPPSTSEPPPTETSITPTPTPSSSSEESSTAASSTVPSSTTPDTTARSGTPSPVVSTRVVTVSGQQVTQTVTSTPFVAPGSDEQQETMSRSGLSGGAIAGIVIGILAAIAALLLAGFLLWRKKKQQDAEDGPPGQRPMKRNTSVLSKTGLLSRSAARPTSMAENNYDDGVPSARHSMLFGGAGVTVEPSSPLGGSQDNSASSRRHSRPMVYDQRLNPSALFANADANVSRVSMQDTQDYSRPLGVANPDLRTSFDSRWSER